MIKLLLYVGLFAGFMVATDRMTPVESARSVNDFTSCQALISVAKDDFLKNQTRLTEDETTRILDALSGLDNHIQSTIVTPGLRGVSQIIVAENEAYKANLHAAYAQDLPHNGLSAEFVSRLEACAGKADMPASLQAQMRGTLRILQAGVAT